MAEYHAKGDEDRAIADFNESIRRGRRPKPTRMKALTGNPGKRPLNRYEPRPNPVMPDCPPGLGPAAQREWARLVGELSSLNMVTNLDRAALATIAGLMRCANVVRRCLIALATALLISTVVPAAQRPYTGMQHDLEHVGAFLLPGFLLGTAF